MHPERDKSDPNVRKAYFDTCVISGVARRDLPAEQQSAVSQLLDYVQSSHLTVCSSTDAKTELLQVPERHRAPHLAAYKEIAILKASAEWLGSTGAFKGPADVTYKSLAKILPDDMDARHLTHALMHGVQDFVTTDERTILRHRDEIRSAVGISVWSPKEYVSSLSTVVAG